MHPYSNIIDNFISLEDKELQDELAAICEKNPSSITAGDDNDD